MESIIVKCIQDVNVCIGEFLISFEQAVLLAREGKSCHFDENQRECEKSRTGVFCNCDQGVGFSNMSSWKLSLYVKESSN